MYRLSRIGGFPLPQPDCGGQVDLHRRISELARRALTEREVLDEQKACLLGEIDTLVYEAYGVPRLA